MSDIHKRAELELKVLMMTSNVKDSDAFWQKENQELVGSSRYFEDPPGYRERTPQNILFFQTRAPPYNTHPAIHSLMPNYELVFQLSDEQYLKARCANTLEFPVIIQWVGSFKAELDATYAAPILYDCNIHFVRSEWSTNAGMRELGARFFRAP